MTSTESPVQQLYKNIGLEVIKYDEKYSRSSGTVGQLVCSLQHMSKRVVDGKDVDAYHTELRAQIGKQCNESVEFYEKLVTSVAPSEYVTFGYYLNGSLNNGKRRPIFAKNERKCYEASKLNETLRSIDDRLRHIKYACIRKKRDDQAVESTPVLENVILFSNSYHEEIQRQLKTWYNFVKELRVKHDFKTKPPTENDTKHDTKKEIVASELPKILIRKKTLSESHNSRTRKYS